MELKVCGLKYFNNIKEVAEIQPDYMGFIFYKNSSRYCGDLLIADQLRILGKKIKLIGVFVNEEMEVIRKLCTKNSIRIVQLHGHESPLFCKELKSSGFQIIKSFGIDEKFDFNSIISYSNYCDFFLFDTKSKLYGGSGKKFNWKLLKNYELDHPFFLSGGISLEDIETIKKHKNPKLHAIDVNSRFEIEAGLKDIHKLKTLKQAYNEF